MRISVRAGLPGDQSTAEVARMREAPSTATKLGLMGALGGTGESFPISRGFRLDLYAQTHTS